MALSFSGLLTTSCSNDDVTDKSLNDRDYQVDAAIPQQVC